MSDYFFPAQPLENLTDSMKIQNLEQAQKFLRSTAIITPDSSLKVRLWIIFGLTLVMGGLNLIILLKNLNFRNYWLVEKDKNGYLNSNIEILVPFFGVLNCCLFLSSIVLLTGDNGRYLSFQTMMTQLTSYTFLFYCAITRVWRILSAIPLVPVQLTPRGTSLLSSGLPPFLFNTLLILVYASFPTVTLPICLKVSRDSSRIGKKGFQMVLQLQAILEQSANATLNDSLTLVVLKEINMTCESFDKALRSTMLLFRIVCGIFLVYCFSLFAVFIYASARIYTTLTLQMQILHQARRRFTRMASVGMRSFEVDLISPHPGSISSSNAYHVILGYLKKAKELMGAQSRDQSELSELWESIDSCTENAELMRKSKISRRYRTAVVWQCVSSSLIFLAFIVLTACLAFNVFGVPIRTTPLRVWFIAFEWSGWASSAPGCVLAFVSCFVTWDAAHGHADSERPKVPSLPSTRKPMLPDSSHPTDSSRSSMVMDIVNLHPNKIFVTHDPSSSIEKATTNSEVESLGIRIWRKLQLTKKALPQHESPRLRKLSCFSFGENEKTGEKALSQPNTESGLNAMNKISGISSGGHVLTINTDASMMRLGHLRSDINIIKSLRDPEFENKHD